MPQTTSRARDSLHAHDWSGTPLGPADGWSRDLRAWTRFLTAFADPAFMVWGEAQTVLFNEPFARLLGARAQEALGAPLTQIWSDHREDVVRITAELRARRAGTLRELPWPASDGESGLRYFDIAYTPLETDDGELLGALCIVQDRSEDVHARRAMISDLDRLRALFEHAPSFFAIVEGPEHRYVLSNAANNRLLGRSDFVGKTVREAFPELEGQGILAILDRVFRTGEPFIGSEVPFEAGPGEARTTRYLDLIYQPMRGPDGTVAGVFAEGHDVTAHREAKERIRALQAELLARTRSTAMNAMASALAHELNQPLTAIGNYLTGAQRIASRDGTSSVLLDAIQSALAESGRAGHIIRKLREMTLTGRITKAPIDLAATIREAVDTALSDVRNVEVRYAIDPIGTAKGDPVQLQQVLINLIRNACEAAAGRPLNIAVSAVRAARTIEICVRDDGPGIDEAIRPVMFDSFTSGKAGGMGVGLSICRAIVEAHGGRIQARNNPDGGATVCFTLPADRVRPPAVR